MTKSFYDNSEQKVENELKYLRDSITALKKDMDKLQWGVRNMDNQISYIFREDTYESINKFSSITSDSETDTSDGVEILACTSKDIPVKKIHESKDLGPVYSKSKKKRNKKKYSI